MYVQSSRRPSKPSPWALAATPPVRMPSSASQEPIAPNGGIKQPPQTPPSMVKPILSPPQRAHTHSSPPQQHHSPHTRPPANSLQSPPHHSPHTATKPALTPSPRKQVTFASDHVVTPQHVPNDVQQAHLSPSQPNWTPQATNKSSPERLPNNNGPPPPVPSREPISQNPTDNHSFTQAAEFSSPPKEPHKTLRVDQIASALQNSPGEAGDRSEHGQQVQRPAVQLVRPQVQQVCSKIIIHTYVCVYVCIYIYIYIYTYIHTHT